LKKESFITALPKTKSEVFLKYSKTEEEWKEDLRVVLRGIFWDVVLRGIFWDDAANGW
jgi:hypothetical protein